MIAERIRESDRAAYDAGPFCGSDGLSQGHLTSIETGKRSVTNRTVMVICNTFSSMGLASHRRRRSFFPAGAIWYWIG